MGNMMCPVEDAALLASVARDICPFPDYNPSPHYLGTLTLNSSLHLGNHYAAVQGSLKPGQLEGFTQGLRSTFGREGTVTLGGVGVVALSLAIFFDSLAKRVKGEHVPESGPIPGLFIKDPRGYYRPSVYTASEYLRLVPYIANNPTRMKEETESYLKLLRIEKEEVADNKKRGREDITSTNLGIVQLIQQHMQRHLSRLANNATDAGGDEAVAAAPGADAADAVKSRKRRIPPPEDVLGFSLNCDAEAASKVFLAEVQKSNHTHEAFKRCSRRVARLPKTWLDRSASLVWMDFINSPMFDFDREKDLLIAQWEDFDLKANSLSKWTA